jgi:hypothetical protein
MKYREHFQWRKITFNVVDDLQLKENCILQQSSKAVQDTY